MNNSLLKVVKPGSQSRRFTHIFDTIEICDPTFSEISEISFVEDLILSARI